MSGETWWVVVEIPAEKQAIYGDFLFDAVAEAADGVTDHRDGWDPSIWAGSDPTAELRARAEKAEAEVERMHRFVAVQNAWANDFREQRDALRDGIQAVLDLPDMEWDHRNLERPPGPLARGYNEALRVVRGLLSPTPEGPPR